jgi:glycerate dehydrogenase
MHRIVYLERESIIANVRRPDFPHHWVEHAKTLQPEVEERLAGATIAIVNKLQIDARLVAALPTLQMVAVAATGTNNVDLDACRSRGIIVSNIRGYAAHTVPEHVFLLLLALSRNLVAYRQAVAAGNWQRSEQFCCFDFPIRDLHGATLAVIGSGSLGSGVARLAEAFGMRVLRSEHKGETRVRPGYTPFEQALREADAISLHCPLTAATKDLIGEAELRAMKPTALLINTARGGLVDEAALASALQRGWIAGAGSMC